MLMKKKKKIADLTFIFYKVVCKNKIFPISNIIEKWGLLLKNRYRSDRYTDHPWQIGAFDFVFRTNIDKYTSSCICLTALVPYWYLTIYLLCVCILRGLLCPNWKAELIIPQSVLGTSPRPPLERLLGLARNLQEREITLGWNEGDVWEHSDLNWPFWLIDMDWGWRNREHQS